MGESMEERSKLQCSDSFGEYRQRHSLIFITVGPAKVGDGNRC